MKVTADMVDRWVGMIENVEIATYNDDPDAPELFRELKCELHNAWTYLQREEIEEMTK